MPTIPVNSDGSVLYYEDSGVPSVTHSYHTIFILHGFIFHGGSFRLLFPHALARNIRLVLINQRDYPGSSRLSETEMANLWSAENDRQAMAVRAQGIELATFIARFIENENLPAPAIDGETKVGGVSLVTWSQGNGILMALLANIALLDAETNALLERYMRTAFVYDPPCVVLGIPASPRLVMPVHKPELSTEEKPQKFIEWASEYWDALRTPQDITTEALLKRSNVYETTGDRKYLNTVLKAQADEVESWVERGAYLRVGATLTLATEVYAAFLRGALFDTNGQWSHLRVVAIWPDMQVEMVQVLGANHIYHYEEPEEFIRLLARYV
ncbi:hypothetical protein BC629DRAFT_1595179 [Irpex lacteus]|nr:hypothetical protein BC629DRAFT_1595179 [Irpex lacteus]